MIIGRRHLTYLDLETIDHGQSLLHWLAPLGQNVLGTSLSLKSGGREM